MTRNSASRSGQEGNSVIMRDLKSPGGECGDSDDWEIPLPPFVVHGHVDQIGEAEQCQPDPEPGGQLSRFQSIHLSCQPRGFEVPPSGRIHEALRSICAMRPMSPKSGLACSSRTSL
jgi:hypothetical protein